jgi:hypothetical protein
MPSTLTTGLNLSGHLPAQCWGGSLPRKTKTPWSAAAPEDVTKPKGARICAKRAVDILLACNRTAESEAKAWSVVEELAQTLNRRLAVENEAPRIGQITERADKVLSLTVELHDFLKSLDAATLFVIRSGGHDFGILQEAVQSKHGPNVESVIETLRQFALALDLNVSLFVDRFPSDNGGNTNYYKRTIGAARLQLVQDAIFAFDRFRPEEAKGTEGGIFHQFLMAIFEYATGLDPESHSKLLRYLKDVTKAYRLRRTAEVRHEQLFEQQKLLRRRPKQNAGRIQELEIQIEKTREQLREHWVGIFPQRKW